MTYDSTRFGRHANNQPFRNMGLGSFMLQVVQLQAVLQGYSSDLYLQANMGTIAASYYQHRGFILTQTNDLKHLPETLWTWYQQTKNEKLTTPYVYFVTDDKLIADAINRKENPDAPEVRATFMHLLKLEGLLKMTGNSRDVNKVYLVEHCLPKSRSDTAFLQFPFLDTGHCMNTATTDMFLLDHIWFKFKDGRDNALCEPIEEPEKFKKVYLSFGGYLLLKIDVCTKNYKSWMNDEQMDFFSKWMMRNKQSPIVQATEIVSCQITGFVRDFYHDEGTGYKNDRFPITLKNIHIYMMTNLDILTKKFILFPLNEGNSHWNGWAAVNPWVQLARVLYERARPSKIDKKEFSFCRGYYKVTNGLISCDGLGKKGIEDSKVIIWFLNLASAYRDMQTDKTLHELNYRNHTARSYWMLGCSGPFGKLNVKNNSLITYKILTLHKDVKPVQLIDTDWFNCGFIWCLFVYDMMLQVCVSYYDIMEPGSSELPVSLGIGKTWLHPKIYEALIEKEQETVHPTETEANHYKMICIDLRVELVCLLERLRYMRLQSFSKHIEKPKDWGVFHSVISKKKLTPIRRIVMTTPKSSFLELRLKEEKEFREVFFSKSTPILPGSLFLAPNNKIITRPVNKPLFPEFEGVVEEIQPESIPFDIDLLLKDIKYFFAPPPNYNKERWELIPQFDDVKQEATKKDQTDSADVP